MSNVWIENGPASRRTLILCMILGLSVAVHRVVVGFKPISAVAGDQLASARDALSGARPSLPPSEPAVPPGAHPAPPTSPTTPSAPERNVEPRPEKREPRLNPYGRRLWVMDPFRAPNVLRLQEPEVPESARPLLTEEQTREVLARTTIEQSTTPEGAARVSITMPGVSAEAGAHSPETRAHTALGASGAAPARTGARPRPLPFGGPLAPCIFAFAGYDLTREEGRRWTLALAFEGREH